jgi:hypothetical protein
MTCLGSTAAVVSPGEEKALCRLSTRPRPHPPRPAGWSGWFRRTALELTTWWIELSIWWEIGWFQTPEQADRACTRLVRFPDTVKFFYRTRCALISGWSNGSNGWYYAHEETVISAASASPIVHDCPGDTAGEQRKPLRRKLDCSRFKDRPSGRHLPGGTYCAVSRVVSQMPTGRVCGAARGGDRVHGCWPSGSV